MKRRDFLRSTAAASAGLVIGSSRLTTLIAAPRWRTFEVTTDIEVTHPSGSTRVWLPVPGRGATAYQKPVGAGSFDAGDGTARVVEDPVNGATMIVAEWQAGVRP